MDVYIGMCSDMWVTYVVHISASRCAYEHAWRHARGNIGTPITLIRPPTLVLKIQYGRAHTWESKLWSSASARREVTGEAAAACRPAQISTRSVNIHDNRKLWVGTCGAGDVGAGRGVQQLTRNGG